MSLAEELKQEDAKYLDAPDITPKDDAPKIEAGGGEEGTAPKPQEISQGAVKAALSYTEAKGDDGEITRTPIVTISVNGKEVAKLEGEETFYADPPVSRADRRARSVRIRIPKWWCRSIRAGRIAARRRAW